MDFSSLNPYQTLVAVEASTPQELVTKLQAIKTPIKIVSITSYGTKQVAYIFGDVRIKKQNVQKKG